MRRISYVFTFFIIITSSNLFSQTGLTMGEYNGAKVLNELVPANFKNYEGKLLVVPGFKAIGMNKFLTKRLDKYYLKPYHVAEVSEVASGLGPDDYSVDEFQYMIFVDMHKSFEGNSVYTFYLVDRKNNIIYYHSSSGNMFKRYLKKILK